MEKHLNVAPSLAAPDQRFVGQVGATVPFRALIIHGIVLEQIIKPAAQPPQMHTLILIAQAVMGTGVQLIVKAKNHPPLLQTVILALLAEVVICLVVAAVQALKLAHTQLIPGEDPVIRYLHQVNLVHLVALRDTPVLEIDA